MTLTKARARNGRKFFNSLILHSVRIWQTRSVWILHTLFKHSTELSTLNASEWRIRRQSKTNQCILVPLQIQQWGALIWHTPIAVESGQFCLNSRPQVHQSQQLLLLICCDCFPSQTLCSALPEGWFSQHLTINLFVFADARYGFVVDQQPIGRLLFRHFCEDSHKYQRYNNFLDLMDKYEVNIVKRERKPTKSSRSKHQ